MTTSFEKEIPLKRRTKEVYWWWKAKSFGFTFSAKLWNKSATSHQLLQVIWVSHTSYHKVQRHVILPQIGLNWSFPQVKILSKEVNWKSAILTQFFQAQLKSPRHLTCPKFDRKPPRPHRTRYDITLKKGGKRSSFLEGSNVRLDDAVQKRMSDFTSSR